MKLSKSAPWAPFCSVATFTIFVSAAALMISCASKQSESKGGRGSQIPDEVSLKADRSAFDEERKGIPEDRRRENDELALVLQMMTEKSDREPSEIRDKFGAALRKRREKSDKIFHKRRDEFSKNEKKTRDDFLNKAKRDRDSYMGGKHSSEERKRFFDDQDDQRREFFADEADRRKDFESQMTEDRKNFEDYAKEKNDEFNQDIRTYTTEFYERKKNEALQKEAKQKSQSRGSAVGQGPAGAVPGEQPGQANEFDSIPKGPGIQLGAPADH